MMFERTKPASVRGGERGGKGARGQHRLGSIVWAGALMIASVSSGSGQAAIPQFATADEAVVLEASELGATLAAMLAGQAASQRLIEGGDVFSVTQLHRTAPTADIHAILCDLYVVQEGSATLVTGGSLVNPGPASRPGDQRGSAILGGTERLVKAGDLVFIPSGMVHGFRDFGDSGSITYLNIHLPWDRGASQRP